MRQRVPTEITRDPLLDPLPPRTLIGGLSKGVAQTARCGLYSGLRFVHPVMAWSVDVDLSERVLKPRLRLSKLRPAVRGF